MTGLRDVVRCPDCSPIGGVDPDACKRCGSLGLVAACAVCLVLPQDPMFAPACGGVCRDEWERARPAPIVRRAP